MGSRQSIAMPFITEKLECRDYPMVKNFDDMFIRYDMIHERDRQTDTHTQRERQTPHDDIGCACIASRGKQ